MQPRDAVKSSYTPVATGTATDLRFRGRATGQVTTGGETTNKKGSPLFAIIIIAIAVAFFLGYVIWSRAAGDIDESDMPKLSHMA